jgi:outer membrane protein assembly factor BamD (BamD/ComL family)
MMMPSDTIGLRKSIADSLKAKNLAYLKDPKNPKNILNQTQSTIKLDSVKFKKNPPQKLKISIDSARTVLSKNTLELGNLFLTDLNVPDSSYILYKKILDDYGSPVYYPNTLYALGSYYLTVDNKAKADSLFSTIYDNYKDRTIVNAAADKLNKPLINLKFDPAKDMYASAEDSMLAGNYSQSLLDFFNIYRQYPKSPIAPQALYTSGWILENDLFLPDSAAVVYDTLIAKYPTSLYVKQVAKKVTTYKQEKVRLQKVLQDSLNALNSLNGDSTLIAENISEDDSLELVEDAFVMNKVKNEEKNIIDGGDEIVDPKKQFVDSTKKKLDPLWDPRKHFN